MLSRVLAIAAFVLLAPLLAGQNPAPKPELLPQLDKSKPPENRPQKAFAREKIVVAAWARPKPEDHSKQVLEPWLQKLSPQPPAGDPAKLRDPRSEENWLGNKATLKFEYKLEGGKVIKHGWGVATWDETGNKFAEGTYYNGKMHGLWRFHNRKGEADAVSGYVENRKTGPYVKFYEGEIAWYGVYRDGRHIDGWRIYLNRPELSYYDWYVQTPKGESVLRYRRTYDEQGRLLVESFHDPDFPRRDEVAWIGEDLDNDGVVTNAEVAGRLELRFRNLATAKLHGWQTYYDPKGGWRKFDTWYEEGEQTGPFIELNESGAVVRRGEKLLGKNHGLWQAMDASGAILWQGTYANGLKTGPWQESEPGEKALNGLAARLFGPAPGMIAVLGRYRDGQRDGTWIWEYKPGTLMGVGAFESGKAQGPWTVYFGDGRSVAAQGDFLQGKMHGAWKFFAKPGVLLGEGRYESGQPAGVWKTYFANGKPQSQKEYDDAGKPKGKWTEWNEDGSVKSEQDHG